MHFEQHTELDNLIAMQNMRTSANKGSNDACDVSVSLTLCEPLSTLLVCMALTDVPESIQCSLEVRLETLWRVTQRASQGNVSPLGLVT